MKNISREDIRSGFEKLGIISKRVVVHSSLSSFGYVEGGADDVLAEIINSFKTVLMPAFCYGSNTAPPAYDRPKQNGCDYSFYDNWERPRVPFIAESAGVEPSMGIISRKLVALPGAKRSNHAWNSWVAYGELSEGLINEHVWEKPNLPLERLSGLEGYILLLGVDLSSCSAIHIAEERAGRRPFIRWAINRDGMLERIRVAGCGKGFNRLMPYCKDMFLETFIGSCKALSAPLAPFIEHIASVIISKPELTRCSINCIRCEDAILGGPVE